MFHGHELQLIFAIANIANKFLDLTIKLITIAGITSKIVKNDHNTKISTL